MSSFIINPNLPEKLDRLIIGVKYQDILGGALDKLGLRPVYMPDNPDVSQFLSSHADLSVLHAGGKSIFLAPFLKGTEFSRQLEELGFRLIFPDIKQNENYPFDAQMNCCMCGKHLICAEKVTDSSIIKYLTNYFSPVFVNQGYVKCSVCVVDESSIITSDRGVYRAFSGAGMNVLLINPGFIELPGFDYGFIGGSAFKISARKIAFTGSLDKHPDKNAILDFLKAREIEPVYLTEHKIFDIGSAVSLTEQ